jgi:FMN phosphatase YigB (HAD superfamily)
MKNKIAVLIDLDDTLLGNDMDHFLPGYLHALSKSIPDVPEKLMIKELMAGTKKMVGKTTSENTLAEVFNSHFYPGIGINKDELENQITQFYQQDFPKLQNLTTTNLESISVVDKIQEAGHPMVIATNPLFPSAAQFHRLAWAGFPTPDGLFKDVTSFENYHFCKPNPEYYAEILFKHGFINMPAVMIGNSFSDDILPAEKLGLSTYWITDQGNKHHSQGILSAAGPLSGVPAWLNDIEEKIAPIEWCRTLDQSITTLRVTPAIFDGFGIHYTPAILTHNPTADDWSINEILQHLLDADTHLNVARVRKFFNELKPFIASMDLDALTNNHSEPIKEYQLVLSQFFSIRTELINLITSATPEITSKQAVHTIFGPTTFGEIIEFIAIHDRNHIQQSLNVLSK